MTQAQHLIERSRRYRDVVRAERTHELHQELSAIADDWLWVGDHCEYWGNDPDDEDKMVWRIHLTFQGATP